MMDKRSESERVGAGAKMPSIAPRTDEIDSEWGADNVSRPGPLPQVATGPEAAAVTSATPVPAAPNPLRKQTLLGIAPIGAERSDPPPSPTATAPRAASSQAPSAPQEFATPLAAVTTRSSNNALRHKTLLGIAPVSTERHQPDATSSSPFDPQRVDPQRVDPQRVESQRVESHRSLPAASSDYGSDDLGGIKPRPPRWLAPAGVAAALALGVVGLRKLDRPPAPIPAELGRPIKAAGAASQPATRPPSAQPGSSDYEAPQPRSEADAAPQVPGGDASTSKLRIHVTSSPTGARLFWKGKPVGTTPFFLEFKAGDRRAYELGLAGYTTRQVVVDGSQTAVHIGLRPEPNAPSAAERRD